jgi:hypothetical protein
MLSAKDGISITFFSWTDAVLDDQQIDGALAVAKISVTIAAPTAIQHSKHYSPVSS